MFKFPLPSIKSCSIFKTFVSLSHFIRESDLTQILQKKYKETEFAGIEPLPRSERRTDCTASLLHQLFLNCSRFLQYINATIYIILCITIKRRNVKKAYRFLFHFYQQTNELKNNIKQERNIALRSSSTIISFGMFRSFQP